MQDIELLVNPVKIKVLTLDTGLIQILDDKFKQKDPKYKYSSKIIELKKKGIKIDDYRHFFSKKKSELPIGFGDELVEFLKTKGFNPIIDDLRKHPSITIPEDYDELLESYDWKAAKKDEPPKFRYYQKEAFDEILKKRQYNGIIEGATAFGKTFLFLGLAKMIDDRILIIFPGKQLVFQTKMESEYFGMRDVGLVSGSSQLVGRRIMLCNYQSLEILEGYENIKKFKTIFVDEMHTAKANTLYSFLKKIPASIRLGFSGTPFKVVSSDAQDKLDNRLNQANLGSILYSKKADELIDEGFLSSITINFLKIDKPYTANYFCDHIEAKDKYIVHNDFRNNVIKELVVNDDKRTLIIVELREHGRILEGLIPGAVYVHGDTDVLERERVKADLNSGKIRTVVSTVVFSQGVDIPNLERMIVACSGKSFYQVIQRIGRGLRKTKEVQKFEVWDFVDATNKYLDKWSRKRWEIYNYEKHPVRAVKMSEILGGK